VPARRRSSRPGSTTPHPGIGYQIDAGDADLATLFYYLGEASRRFARRIAGAAAAHPEYQHDVVGFSRRFFRELFALLPDGAAIVLDNYQEVEARHPFHALCGRCHRRSPGRADAARRESARSTGLLRSPSPNENVGIIDWNDLNLTLDETGRDREGSPAALGVPEVERLSSRAVAGQPGLTLMLDGYRRNNGISPGRPAERETVFAYFAAQIFERLPEATRISSSRRRFCRSARVTGQGTDRQRAHVRNLEGLCTSAICSLTAARDPTNLLYHALFRSFLMGKPRRFSDRIRWRDVERRAARLLDARGDLTMRFQDIPGGTRLASRAASDRTGTLTPLARGKAVDNAA